MTARARSQGVRAWGAVHIRASEEQVVRLAAQLGNVVLGVEVRAHGGGKSEAVVYLETPAAAREAAGWVRGELQRSGEAVEAGAVRPTRVTDEGWVEMYQASLIPFALGSRFTVYPKGKVEGQREPGRIPLLVEPGRAFGTGEHPTTRLVVEALEREVSEGSSWVDLGCGTGLLALVARHAGARRVLALDIDPEAVDVARAVTQANHVGAIDVEEGSLEQAGVGHDGLAANIIAPFFLSRAAALSEPLKPGGVLVASGFLVEELDAVRGALSGAGWVETSSACDGGWAALTLTASLPPRS